MNVQPKIESMTEKKLIDSVLSTVSDGVTSV